MAAAHEEAEQRGASAREGAEQACKVCEVCIEPLGAESDRRAIDCPGCAYAACAGCAKRYLLGCAKPPGCMACGTAWSEAFLLRAFTKAWVTGNRPGQYRAHRKQVALEAEKAKIPATLAEMSRKRQYKIAQRRLVAELEAEICYYKGELAAHQEFIEAERAVEALAEAEPRVKPPPRPRTLGHEAQRGVEAATATRETLRLLRGETLHTYLAQFAAERRALTAGRDEFEMLLAAARRRLRAIKQGSFRHATVEPVFMGRCPADRCNGLVERPGYACTVCARKVCKKCHAGLPAPKSGAPPHSCSQAALATLELVREDTKQCPSCYRPIHRIDGCDQMWCTQCQTPFSWRTGEIVTGVIHNPHAVLWLRKHGRLRRDLADIPCGGLIELTDLPPEVAEAVAAVHQTVAECGDLIAQVGRRELRRPRSAPTLEEMREQFIRGLLAEGAWKDRLFARERAFARRRANVEILTTFQTVAVERLRDLCETVREGVPAPLAAFMAEMEAIRCLANAAFAAELPPLGAKKPYYIPPQWGTIETRAR